MAGPQFLGYPTLLGEPQPSKWERLKQALWETNLNAPIRGAYNLMNTPYDVLMGEASPEKEQAVADSFDAAGGVTVGSMPMPKPANSLTMGASAPKKYSYSMLYRPPANANVPEGFTSFGPATAEHKFGIVEYDKPLSSKQLTDYEMVPLDPNHPMNIKKSFNDFHGKFMDEFSNAGETYQSPSGDYIVSPNIRGDGWQITMFTPEGEAAGHEVVTDFDELARFVWAQNRINFRKSGGI